MLDEIAKKERKGILFIIFISTLASFLAARSFVWITHQTIHLIIDGYVIHHSFIGILLVVIAGFLSLVFKGDEAQLAVIYGLGLGLIIDEFGFLVSWGNYWNRLSYDLLIIVSLIILNLIFFEEFWKKFKKKIKRIIP